MTNFDILIGFDASKIKGVTYMKQKTKKINFKKLDEKVIKELKKIDYHKIIYVFFLIFFLQSCTHWNNSKTMSILGAGTAGYSAYSMGSKMVGKEYGLPIALAGTLVGAFLGSEIGSNMDQNAQVINLSLDELKIDESKLLTNTDESTSETLVTKSEFQLPNNTLCKKFEWTIEKNGEIVRCKGTACKNSDGDWVSLGNIMM